MDRVGIGAVALLVAFGLLGGCAGGEEAVLGLGTLTVTGYSSPTPALIPEIDTITGAGFQELVGTPCTVRYTAVGGATIFDGGRSDTVDVIGTITSPTTCQCTSPIADICGPTSVFAFVTIILPSGVFGTSTVPIAEFVAPTAVSIAGPGGGTVFPAAVPSAFVITGTGFGPIGGEVSITWTSGSALFEAGASQTTQTKGIITSATTIAGVSPLALVCGVASIAASITNVQFDKNTICTPTGTNIPVSFTAPTVTTVLNAGVAPYVGSPNFAAAVAEPFTVNGTGFGPLGGTVEITFNSQVVGPVYNGGTSPTTTVLGTITSSSTIAADFSPLPAICTAPSDLQSVMVTMPDGACSQPTGTATFIAPTIQSIANLDRPTPLRFSFFGRFFGNISDRFEIVGTDFGPVGGTAFVTFTVDTALSPVPATPFEGGTSLTTTVEATITSRTTMEGMSPLAVIGRELTDTNNTSTVCVTAGFSTDISFVLEGGSCPPVPLNDPQGGLDFVAPGPVFNPLGVNDVPSTILLGANDPEPFTLTGDGFGPPGSIAMVTFSDPGNAVFNGADSITVPAVVTNVSTLNGRLPTITAPRLAEDVGVRVVVTVFNGSFSWCDQVVNFVAPPTITSLTSTRQPFDQNAPAVALTTRWLGCVGSDTTISGNAFDPAITDLWYDQVLGDAFPIGAGLLGTIPEPTATAPGPGTLRTVTDNLFPVADTINGLSPVDNTLTKDTLTTLRVVNPDGQFDMRTSLTFATTGVMPNVNAGPDGGVNSEMQIAVNPTNVLNAAVCAHDLSTVNGQFSNQIYHSYTLDGGDTWVQFPIGPDTTAAPDGLGPAPRVFRFDPMCAFDAFGNYYAIYLADDNEDESTRFCVAQQSADGGASFGNVRLMAFPAVPGLDRETVATGPDAAVPGNQAVYVGIEDLGTQDQLCAGFTVPGLGLIGADYPSVIVNDGAPVGGFAHATPSVGPNGELYFSFIESSGIWPAATTSTIWFDTDIDGLGGAAFTFGTDVAVATTVNPGRRIDNGQYLPQPSRGKGLIPMSQVLLAGPNAGRVVICWTDMLTDPGRTVLDTTVMSQYSDDNGATWSTPLPVHGLHSNFQFFPWMGVDEVRGDIYIGYYDTRNDPANTSTEWMMAASEDGVHWTNSFLVAQAPSRAGAYAGANNRADMLEYNGVAVSDGCVYTCWADNANFTGDNPDGTLNASGWDVLTSVLMIDPDDN